MDKIAANNHFVALRKEIKKAKAMVSGNLIRKIKELKQELDKIAAAAEDQEKRQKLEHKIDSIHQEIKLIKTLDPYDIAKQATLRPDAKLWDKVIGDSRATSAERLIARIIVKNNIQKRVSKFRSDHVDLDEWLEQYIEYREKKRQIRERPKR